MHVSVGESRDEMHACLRGGWICFNYVVVLVYTNSQISTTRFCERVMTWTSSTRQTMEVIPDGDALAGRICCQSLVLGPSSGPKLHWNSEKRQCFGTKWPPKLNPGSYYYKVRFYKASKRKWHLFCFVLFCFALLSTRFVEIRSVLLLVVKNVTRPCTYRNSAHQISLHMKY